MNSFPDTRLRRNRSSSSVRRLTREHSVNCDDLIWPLFVMEGKGKSVEVSDMPGVQCHSIDNMLKQIEQAVKAGIPAVALFPRIEDSLKDDKGSEALNPDNLVCRALREARKNFPDLSLIADVALDPFTAHGHDGLLVDGRIVNDPTCEVLAKQAVLQAEAGCDILAPSDMMDGRIGIIRKALDKAGFEEAKLLSYAVKYASSFYAPFRSAVGSKNRLKGDKATYQMDVGNAREAIREASLDIDEGADMIMVKPGMPHLDIIRLLADRFDVPIFAYQVSGEYSMMKLAMEKNILSERAIYESLIAFKRAGACAIISYFALDAARALQKQASWGQDNA